MDAVAGPRSPADFWKAFALSRALRKAAPIAHHRCMAPHAHPTRLLGHALRPRAPGCQSREPTPTLGRTPHPTSQRGAARQRRRGAASTPQGVPSSWLGHGRGIEPVLGSMAYLQGGERHPLWQQAGAGVVSSKRVDRHTDAGRGLSSSDLPGKPHMMQPAAGVKPWKQALLSIVVHLPLDPPFSCLHQGVCVCDVGL